MVMQQTPIDLEDAQPLLDRFLTFLEDDLITIGIFVVLGILAWRLGGRLLGNKKS